MLSYRIKNYVRNLSRKNDLFSEIYSLLSQLKSKLFLILDDEKFAKVHYRQNTGLLLDVNNPKRFNERLWWLKINNRDPLLTICSDKVKVRDYVSECGLSHTLTKCYGVYDQPSDIDFLSFNKKVAVKCNHVSGVNYFYEPGADVPKWFYRKFSSALRRNYYLASREWNYKNIPPKILVEEFLESPEPLLDYRFLCFDGIVKIVFIDKDTAADTGLHNPYAVRNVYDRNFQLLPVKVGRDNYDAKNVVKPDNWDEMLGYAERLAEPFPFCRVDFYNIGGKIIFGEMTFYPGGCCQKVEPFEWDMKLGSWIDIDSSKIKLTK